MRMSRALAAAFFCALWVASGDVARGDWRMNDAAGRASQADGEVVLELGNAGDTSAVLESLVVPAGGRVHMEFEYRAEAISSDVRLSATVQWRNHKGQDVDDDRRALGFPPLARVWQVTKPASESQTVADNLTVPDKAAAANVIFRLERSAAGKPARVRIGLVKLDGGEIIPQGIEMVRSGPDDAGTLSAPPSDVKFAPNLVPNAALEEGDTAPSGWKIEGNNAQGAAEWISGGAYSGRRCLKVWDRSPYVTSWARTVADPYLPGGAPGGNYAGAREEVAARWVSEPSPATPGETYQANGFVWYADRRLIDRGSVSPIRIQFLDAQGNVIPYATLWDDWMVSQQAFQREGWAMLLSKPLVAPPQAASVRVAVALGHSFFQTDGATTVRLATDRGYVLVDNIALYRVAGSVTTDAREAPDVAANEAFWKTAEAGGLPFVPTSPAHRPAGVSVDSDTVLPGGMIVADPSSPPEARAARLKLSNWLADSRDLHLSYQIVDIQNTVRAHGDVPVKLPPYQQQSAKLDYPADLPLGPYAIRYSLREGGHESDRGEARLSLLPKRQVSVEERGRMDYPFSLWVPDFRTRIGTADEVRLGRLMEMTAMGKTWFGGKGPIYLQQFLTIRDPVKRAEAVQKRVTEAREAIAVWHRYGVTPMGQFENPQLVRPEDYPILAEIVSAFVTALKSDIHVWRYGTESMHGGVKELDRDTMPAEESNVQGGRNYLYWGRQGTVRQYWAEYFVVHQAAKDADPTCLIGPQNASDVQGNVLRLYFKVGTTQQMDIFGMNTYNSAFSIWPANMRELGTHNAEQTPIFVSEFDAQARCSPFAPDHLLQENRAAAQQVAYWASVLHAFPTLFHLEQYVLDLSESDMSLAQKGEARPQLLAIGTMADNLGAGTFVAKYELPGADVYVRRRSVRPGQVAVVVAKSEPTIVELEVRSPKATICDLWGNRHEVASDHGVVQIEATKMPVYVMDVPEIRLAKTVGIEIVHATQDAASPEVEVVVSNDRAEPVEGTVRLIADSAVRIREARQETGVIKAGGQKRLRFQVQPLSPEGDHRLPMRARLETGKRTYEGRGGLNFHFADRMTKAPAIDGDPGDWPAACSELVADRPDQVRLFASSKKWEGAADLSGKARLAWDAEKLYVCAIVDDDVLALSPVPGREFAFDSIELLVDVTRGLSRSAPLTMFTLANFVDGQPRVRRYDGVLPAGDIPSATIAVVRRGSQTFYEAAIPWQEIAPDFKPARGRAIGIALSFDDHDGGNTARRCISWFSAATDKNPAAFGDVVLSN